MSHICIPPTCEDALKPLKGRYFVILEVGIQFYKEYARAVGFDVRMSSMKKLGETITWRYVVCTREVEKYSTLEVGNDDDYGNVKRRRHISMRCGCPTKVVFKLNGLLGYIVHLFREKHNHPLVDDQYKNFMKLNSNLDHMHQKFILDCARVNIGTTHSYKLLTELLGGQDGVGYSILDVRNFTCDMKAFIQDSDAQMMLNELARKKEKCSAFTYDYEVDCDDKLIRVFWCDPIAKRNYHMFGDVVTFDTTYSTNK